MKPVRYIVGVISFFFIWFMVAVLVGLGVYMVFPPEGEVAMVGIGPDWRNLPGTILGLLAGIQSFRRSIRDPAKKNKPGKPAEPTQT